MKTVIFDVDDTLYDQIVPFKQAVEQALSIDLKEVDLTQLYLDFRFFSDEVFHQAVDGSLSLADMHVYRITKAFQKVGIEIQREMAELFQKNYQQFQQQIVIQEDMEQLLQTLAKEPITLGILTNGPTNHQQEKIKQLNVGIYIPQKHQFISEEIGSIKPELPIFKYVQTSLEKKPSDLIYVGDSYENDVIGAKGAGWTSLWINKYGKDISQEVIQPDREVATYLELKQVLIEELNGKSRRI